MSDLVINDTPVRTSNNFLINNIKIENIEIPNKVKTFETVEIIKENAEVSINNEISNNEKLNSNDNLSNKSKLTYGLGNELEKNVFLNANHRLKIVANKKDNIKIDYKFDEENRSLINSIYVEANADLNLTIQYESEIKDECFHNGILKLVAKPDVKVNVTIVNLLNDDSYNFEAIENELQDRSEVNYVIVDLGAKTSVSNYYSNVIGNDAKNTLKTIYLGTGKQLKDINYIVHLRGKKSNVDIDVQGALNDNSKKNFKGTIDFKKGCKKAKGSENEYCILLSDNAKSIALPMLLCTEEDVEGNHSTASGKVAPNELFYIMSRGIEYKEAIKLLVRANFNRILEKIADEEIRNKIFYEIDAKLDVVEK